MPNHCPLLIFRYFFNVSCVIQKKSADFMLSRVLSALFSMFLKIEINEESLTRLAIPKERWKKCRTFLLTEILCNFPLAVAGIVIFCYFIGNKCHFCARITRIHQTTFVFTRTRDSGFFCRFGICPADCRPITASRVTEQ